MPPPDRKYKDLSWDDKALIDALLERHNALMSKPRDKPLDPSKVKRLEAVEARSNLTRVQKDELRADILGDAELVLVPVTSDLRFSIDDMVDWVNEVTSAIELQARPLDRPPPMRPESLLVTTFPLGPVAVASIWSLVAENLLVIDPDMPTDTLAQKMTRWEVTDRTAEVRTFPEHFLVGLKLGSIYQNLWVTGVITKKERNALLDGESVDPVLQAFVDKEVPTLIADLPSITRRMLDQQGDVGQFGADNPGDFDTQINKRINDERTLHTDESMFTSLVLRVTKSPEPYTSSGLFEPKDNKLDLVRAATNTFLIAKPALDLSGARAEDGFNNARKAFQGRLEEIQAQLENIGATLPQIAEALIEFTDQFVESGGLAQSVETERLLIFDAYQSAKTNVNKQLRDSGEDGFVEKDFSSEFYAKMVNAIWREGPEAFALFPLERLLEEKAFAGVDSDTEINAAIDKFLRGKGLKSDALGIDGRSKLFRFIEDARSAEILEQIPDEYINELVQAQTALELIETVDEKAEQDDFVEARIRAAGFNLEDIGHEAADALALYLNATLDPNALNRLTDDDVKALVQAETNRNLLPAPPTGLEAVLGDLGIRGGEEFQKNLRERVIPRLTPMIQEAVAQQPDVNIPALLGDILAPLSTTLEAVLGDLGIRGSTAGAPVETGGYYRRLGRSREGLAIEQPFVGVLDPDDPRRRLDTRTSAQRASEGIEALAGLIPGGAENIPGLDPVLLQQQIDPTQVPSPLADPRLAQLFPGSAMALEGLDFPQLHTNIVGQPELFPEPTIDLGFGDLKSPAGRSAFWLKQLQLTGDIAGDDLVFQQALIDQLPSWREEFAKSERERLADRQAGIREQQGFLTVEQSKVLHQIRNEIATKPHTDEERAELQRQLDESEMEFRVANLSTPKGRKLRSELQVGQLLAPLEPADFGTFVKGQAPAFSAIFEALPTTISQRQEETAVAERREEAAKTLAEEERRLQLSDRGRTVIRGMA